MMLGAFPLWWALGFGEIAWIPLAMIMVGYMVARGGIEAPRGFGIWLLFLVWVLLSVIGIDTGGRLIGFVYRLLLYLVVTVVFLYVYNARESITHELVARNFSLLLLWVVFGGFAGIIFPLFSFRTPLGLVVPHPLQSNELVREMIVRRLTQYNPESWVQVSPRPSAPFLYTNGWGNVYSMILPVVVGYFVGTRRHRLRICLVVLVALSLVPAAVSLNRGMFLGLGVAVSYISVALLFRGRAKAMFALLLSTCLVLGVAFAFDVQTLLESRLASGSSTQDRANLYRETFERTMESPIFGFGAPRPSETPGAPSVGTQGHVWSVMFSQGLPGVALFLGWLSWSFVATIRNRGPGLLMLSAVLLVILVECFYYGVLPDGLILSMTAAALLLRVRRPGDVAPPQLVTTA